MKEELRNKYRGYIYRKSKFGVIVLALLIFSGCAATTQVIDRLAPGTSKGFVEFREEWNSNVPSEIYIFPEDFISIDEISQDGKIIGTEKWSTFNHDRFRISAIGGYHEYDLNYHSFNYERGLFGKGIGKCRVRVYEGMITPVLIKMIVESSEQKGMSQEYGVSVYTTTESPVPVSQKR